MIGALQNYIIFKSVMSGTKVTFDFLNLPDLPDLENLCIGSSLSCFYVCHYEVYKKDIKKSKVVGLLPRLPQSLHISPTVPGNLSTTNQQGPYSFKNLLTNRPFDLTCFPIFGSFPQKAKGF